MLFRFSHHRSPVLNHTDPINPQHGLRCTADASPFAITAGLEALCCDHLNLACSQVAQTLTVAPREALLGGVWSSVTEAIPVSQSGATVSRKRHWCLQGNLVQDSLHFITSFALLITPTYQCGLGAEVSGLVLRMGNRVPISVPRLLVMLEKK